MLSIYYSGNVVFSPLRYHSYSKFIESCPHPSHYLPLLQTFLYPILKFLKLSKLTSLENFGPQTHTDEAWASRLLQEQGWALSASVAHSSTLDLYQVGRQRQDMFVDGMNGCLRDVGGPCLSWGRKEAGWEPAAKIYTAGSTRGKEEVSRFVAKVERKVFYSVACRWFGQPSSLTPGDLGASWARRMGLDIGEGM